MRLCKASLTTKLILLALLVFGIVSVIGLLPKIDACEAEADALSCRIDALELENEGIKDDIRALGSDESAVKIARERLNLVFENELIFIDGNE